MSIPATEQVSRFLSPLKGSVTVLLVHDKATRMTMSRFLIRCAYLQAEKTSILDTDAFYCANIDRLTERTSDDDQFLANTQVFLLPEGTFKVSDLTPLISPRTRLLILDDLNSLYSLASDNRKSHALSVFMKLLSHNARMNASWVIATAYRTERGAQDSTNRRSVAGLGDLIVDTEFRGDSLLLRAGFKSSWPNDEFSF